MKQDLKFYVCKHCGNVITYVHNAGPVVVCCGEDMTEIKANTVDASAEKHVPVVTVDGNTVTVAVGSVEHPMTAEHFIQWIYLETEKGVQMKYLTPDSKPVAVFEVKDDKAVAAYEYCNLHGLWKTVI